MKEVKAIAIATVITICLIVSCAFATPANAEAEAEAEDFYWKLVVVMSCEDLGEELLISCEDRYGDIWEFYDDEYEWKVGDYGYLLMWICTDDPTDDEVIDTQWEGYTERPDLFWHAHRVTD